MKAEEFAQIRSESGLTQGEFAILLNEALGMSYRSTQVTGWEKGTRKIPDYVADAAMGLAGKKAPVIEEETRSESEGSHTPSGSYQPEDSSPSFEVSTALSVPTSLEAACIEMFSGIGMMVEVAGGIMGGPKVVTILEDDGSGSGQYKQTKISLLEYDGKIIQSDAVKLGKAWAKLAERNEWVSRILLSLTGGGIWVEVLAATVGTLNSIYKNHVGYAEYLSKQAETNGHAPAESTTEEEGATI